MSSNEELKHLHISFQHILSATNKFAEENYLGLGGFGKVYKGESETYGIIAVKRLDRDRGGHGQGDHEFKTEIALLSIYKHENIVSLQGFCDEDGEKILVYKYESNGSLDKYLKNPDLTWTQRLQICLGAARGLKYLHHDVVREHRMIHRDVKSANILLDENWNAKVADFGLSRKGPANASFVNANACGTIGYIDPEYQIADHLTPKSDVFSFGVVLFEVLCGRPAFHKVDDQLFYLWVQKHYSRKILEKIIYPDLHGQINPASLLTFSTIAYKCLGIGVERPTMEKVVEQLQIALNNQLASGSGSYVYDDCDVAALGNQRHSRHESKGVEQIAANVSDSLLSLNSNDDEDLIGISARLEELRSHLEVEQGGVRMIGIWGIGGGGKTTLASSIYDEISSKFDGCCFLDNIREKSCNGFEILQEKLLSGILKQKDINVGRVKEGMRMIKSRLSHRKVLIVLDDVDHLDQLNTLAGRHDWFGEGSRIIITTRDNHLLNAHKVNLIYNIRLLNDDEAIKLFCKHAQQDYTHIDQEYETLSKAVVSYAGGLPLALKVVGSFLCDKDINEWKSTLARLKDIPEDDIIGKLKISYDGLKPTEKELFLDIACFYRGGKVEEAMVSLDACGFYPTIGIKVLIQKALISISYKDNRFNVGSTYDTFDMHDLVQELGQYIVQGEHPNSPERHSRVWKEKDILSICSMNSTLNNDKIEALGILISKVSLPKHLPQVIANMINLRSIHWNWYPQSVLPDNFQPTKLCCLILQGNKLIQLWEGYKHLPNLKVLDLSSSRKLIKTPDLEGLPRLERLILNGCYDLKEIHPSIGCHESLVFLDMDGCWNLKMFPPIIRMPKLVTLILSNCCMLRKFPDIKTNMYSLVDIRLPVSGIEVLPSSIVQFCTNLVSLDLSYCIHLKSIEGDYCCFKKLKELHLRGCSQLETPAQNLFNVDCCLEVLSLFPSLHSHFFRSHHLPRFLTSLSLRSSILASGNIHSDIICELSNLQILDLSDNNFSRIYFNLVKLPRLKFLNMAYCERLVELPDLPSSIAILDVNGCDSLIIKDFPTTYKWLWKVSLGYETRGAVNVLQSVFQVNVIEDHFMSFIGCGVGIPRGLGFDISTRSFASDTFTLLLPPNWYSDYSGFLICVARSEMPDLMIVIKQEMHMDYQACNSDAFTKIREICYIPFSSLMHKPLWTGNISFFINWCTFKVELVPRQSKGGSTERSTDRSEFLDEQIKGIKTFTIQQTSGSSIEIIWLR